MSDPTAVHEAGHVVMLIRTGGRLKWVKLTDDPRSSEDGRCRAESGWTHDASVVSHFAERRWGWVVTVSGTVGVFGTLYLIDVAGLAYYVTHPAEFRNLTEGLIGLGIALAIFIIVSGFIYVIGNEIQAWWKRRQPASAPGRRSSPSTPGG
jgi:hypothetical protein